MGRRGRLGGLAGRRDRASDRRRELADLHYDGSAPSACALLQEPLHLAVPIAAERVGATRADQICRVRKERAHATIRVAVPGSERVGVNRYRKNCVFCRNSRADRLPPYLRYLPFSSSVLGFLPLPIPLAPRRATAVLAIPG